MTVMNPGAGEPKESGVHDGDRGPLYGSAVRFLRLYAMFSPTMVAVLMAKKSRYGRFIPLPDALPDGFRPGLWPRQGTPQVRSIHDVSVTATGKNGHPGKNGTTTRNSGSGATRIEAVRVVDYEVVHQIAGRIRISIPRLAFDDKFAKRLLEQVTEVPTVSFARISASSRSLVVEYGMKAPGSQTGQGKQTDAGAAMATRLVECIRAAAGVDAARDVTPEPTAEEQGRINVAGRLRFPVAALGLSAGLLADLAVPVWLVGGAVLVAAAPIFKRSAQGIRDEKRLTVEFLDATTIVLMVSQASFLAPAIIVTVIESSELARDWTARRSKQASMELMLSMKHSVLVERGGERARRSWDEVEADDELLLYPGDQIPVDGVVMEGSALVDRHRVSGDSTPVVCEPGDEVHAAAMVVGGHVRVLALRTGHDTVIGETLAQTRSAPSTDTRVSNYARKVGNWAVVPTLLVGGAVYATSGSVAWATSVVNLDLGTGMRVSSPIAILTAQRHAARSGILIRSGRALEMLATCDVMVFDKTATLTEGRARVVQVTPANPDILALEVLALASSAEQAMSHPIGEAIVHHAQEQGLVQEACTSWDYVAGLGVVAEIGGKVVRVGNRALMAQAGIDATHFPSQDGEEQQPAATRVFVSRGPELIGAISCVDPIRQESAGVIGTLHALGLETLVASGDRRAVVEATAASLGIAPDRVYAELGPQQKLEAVQALQADGHTVAVVGDGINDAAAMAHSNVAIALGNASDLARETADIVLANNDLRDLVVAIDISRQALRILEQNKALVLVPNIAGIAYGALTALNPVTAMIINNGSALVAALNSLRPLRGPGNVLNKAPGDDGREGGYGVGDAVNTQSSDFRKAASQ